MCIFVENKNIMTLQQLEYIIAVDRFRHFGNAADYCNVTQPTLSAMIQKLEDDYWRAFDFYRLISVWYNDNQPQTIDEPWSVVFILALRWRAIAKFNLEEASWAMLKR